MADKSVVIEVQSDPDAPIVHFEPTRRESWFQPAQTVYLAKEAELNAFTTTVPTADYMESTLLLFLRGPINHLQAIEAADSTGKDSKSASYWEKYLQALIHDSDLKLVHILASCDLAEGFSYQVFGFLPGDKNK